MNNYLSFLLAFVIISALSCSKENPEPPEPVGVVDSAFQPYVDQFFDELEKHRPDVIINKAAYTIQFGALSTNTIGQCNELGGHEMLIDRFFWESADDFTRQVLIFHELGHCVLNRMHQFENLRLYNCPSIMTPQINGKNCGLDFQSPMWRTFYLKELFGLEKKPDWWDIGTDFDLGQVSIDTLQTDTLPSGYIFDYVANLDFQVSFNFSAKGAFSSSFGDYTCIVEDNGRNVKLLFQNREFYFLDSFLNVYWSDNKPFSLTFRMQNDHIYFFIDDTLIHNREYVHQQSSPIEVDDVGSIFDSFTISTWQ